MQSPCLVGLVYLSPLSRCSAAHRANGSRGHGTVLRAHPSNVVETIWKRGPTPRALAQVDCFGYWAASAVLVKHLYDDDIRASVIRHREQHFVSVACWDISIQPSFFTSSCCLAIWLSYPEDVMMLYLFWSFLWDRTLRNNLSVHSIGQALAEL